MCHIGTVIAENAIAIVSIAQTIGMLCARVCFRFPRVCLSQKLVVQEIWANAHETRENYSSSCSQTVSQSATISSQFILVVCAAAEDRKNQYNPLFWKLRVFQSHPSWYD